MNAGLIEYLVKAGAIRSFQDVDKRLVSVTSFHAIFIRIALALAG